MTDEAIDTTTDASTAGNQAALQKFEERAPAEVPAIVEANGFLAVIERLSAMPDIPVDKIKQLFEMQEAALDRTAKQAFNIAMVKAQAEMPQVPKDKINMGTKPPSPYSSYEIIVKHTSPIYTSAGFALSMYEGAQSKEDQQFPLIPDGNIRTFCDVMHSGGWSKTYYVDIPIDDKGPQGTVNKTQPHAKKSSLSYGKSALMCLIFNIPTGGGIDDDGNAAGGKLAEFIDDKQLSQIVDMINAKNVDEVQFLGYMGVEATDEIPAKDFSKAMIALKKAKGMPKKREAGSDDS